MISPKTLRAHQIRTLFRLQHPSLFHLLNPKPLSETHLAPSIHTKSSVPISIFNRNISLSSLFQHDFATQEANSKSKKPLEALFAEAVGLSNSDIEDGEKEKHELKKRLRKLELELRRNRADSMEEADALSDMFSKPLVNLFPEVVGLSKNGQDSAIDNVENGNQEFKTSSGLFRSTDQRERSTKESKKVEESMDLKELSPDMAMFAKYLHRKGYLMNANFLPNNKFDLSCFENDYSRAFLKFASENFAMDHREISMWLPDGDLKKLAQFGCPSPTRKNVFSAKSMRLFYGIQEEPVCNRCILKESCKFANQSVWIILKESCTFANQGVWKKESNSMDLAVVMRVVTSYALEAVPRRLDVPDDIKNTVNRLLKEVIRLSELKS